MDDAAAIAGKMSQRAANAIRNATVRDGETYVYTFAPVPSRLISHQVWGRGDALNSDGLAVRSILLSETNNG